MDEVKRGKPGGSKRSKAERVGTHGKAEASEDAGSRLSERPELHQKEDGSRKEMNEAEGEAGIQKRLTVSSERNRALLKGQEAGCGNVLLHAVGGGRWRQPGLHSQLEATLGYMRLYLKKKKKKEEVISQ